MSTNTALYDQDFYAWTQAQAALLAGRQFDALDIPHLVEEITSWGKSEQRELYHRLCRLLTHLLKVHLAVQALPHDLERAGRGWRTTVKTQRLEVAKVLRDNPSLRDTVPDELADAYPVARLEAAGDLALDEAALPETCPWAPAQVLDAAFWPEVPPDARQTSCRGYDGPHDDERPRTREATSRG
jgi:hypothetical protein